MFFFCYFVNSQETKEPAGLTDVVIILINEFCWFEWHVGVGMKSLLFSSMLFASMLFSINVGITEGSSNVYHWYICTCVTVHLIIPNGHEQYV